MLSLFVIGMGLIGLWLARQRELFYPAHGPGEPHS
jgi:hypothetical protein